MDCNIWCYPFPEFPLNHSIHSDPAIVSFYLIIANTLESTSYCHKCYLYSWNSFKPVIQYLVSIHDNYECVLHCFYRMDHSVNHLLPYLFYQDSFYQGWTYHPLYHLLPPYRRKDSFSYWDIATSVVPWFYCIVH